MRDPILDRTIDKFEDYLDQIPEDNFDPNDGEVSSVVSISKSKSQSCREE